MAKGSSFNDSLTTQLRDPEFAAEYLANAIKENDSDYLNIALSDVAKAHGVSQISEVTGLARQAIYKMLSEDGNPTLQSINLILDAIGLELSIKPKAV